MVDGGRVTVGKKVVVGLSVGVDEGGIKVIVGGKVTVGKKVVGGKVVVGVP